MNHHLDELEPRTLLSAPTAAIQSTTIAPDQWLIVVRYADTEHSIDPTTIGNADITVAGPAGYSQAATLYQRPFATGSGSYVGVYSVPAPMGAWDYGANGAYTVRVASGAVADQSGESTIAADLRTYNLWFNNPAVRIARNTIETNLRWWEMTVNVGDNMGIANLTVGQEIVEVTTPDGSSYRGTVLSSTRVGPRDLSVVIKIGANGRLWDFSDNGRYSVRLLANSVYDTAGVAANARLLGSYNLWFTAPKIEITNSELTDSKWLLTVRFSDNEGIDPESFFGTRPTLSVSGPAGLNYNRISRWHVEPSANPDGSYSAVIFFQAPRGYWTFRESGQYRIWSQGGATDTGGVRVAAGQFAEFDLAWSSVDGQLDTSRSSSTSNGNWDVELVYRAAGTLSSGSFSSDDIAASGPGSTSYSASLISAVQESAGVWRVKYRFSTAGAFAAGSYQITLNAGSVSDSLGNLGVGYTFAALTLTAA